MSIVSRKFSACPVRTASETWSTICDVLEGGRSELAKISGIAASLIAEATPKENPITIIGNGPRLRVYCIYDEEGSTEEANESPINWDLFGGDWKIYLPVGKDDLAWVKKALQEKGPRFKAYQTGEKVEGELSSDATVITPLSIDIEKLKSYG